MWKDRETGERLYLCICIIIFNFSLEEESVQNGPQNVDIYKDQDFGNDAPPPIPPRPPDMIRDESPPPPPPPNLPPPGTCT